MKTHGETATWQRIVSALQRLPDQEALASRLKKKFALPMHSSGQCQKQLTFSAMDEVLKELNQITDSFALLTRSIKLKARIKASTDASFKEELFDYLDEYLETDGKLLRLQSTDELFGKIRDCYCFFHYDPLVKIVRELEDSDLQNQLDAYNKKLELFKSSTTICQLKSALEEAALSSNTTSTSKYNQVVLQLNKGWKEHSVKN